MGKKSKQVTQEDGNDTEAMETTIDAESGKQSYEELLNHVSVIAKPMASRKLTKRIYKVLKKGK